MEMPATNIIRSTGNQEIKVSVFSGGLASGLLKLMLER